MYLLQGFSTGGGGAAASWVGTAVGSGAGGASGAGGTSATAGGGGAVGGTTTSFAGGMVGTSAPSMRFLFTQPMLRRKVMADTAKNHFELFIPCSPWSLQPPFRILWEQSRDPSRMTSWS